MDSTAFDAFASIRLSSRIWIRAEFRNSDPSLLPHPPDIEEFRSYLEKCFDFEQVTVKKFRTWAERRQFNRDLKRKQAESERPILPANQKLITLSVQDAPTKKGKYFFFFKGKFAGQFGS